jgi:hypothetical protein
MATTGTTTWPLTTVYARIWKTELIATTKGRASRSPQGRSFQVSTIAMQRVGR